jgi:hypothetical protein
VTIRRLELLQWFGFVAGGVLWFATFAAGSGVATAACNPSVGGFAYDAVQVALLCFAVVVLLAAEAAAVLVFRATRTAGDEGTPPSGRMRLVAIGAMAGNLLFLVIIVLSVVGTLVNRTCHTT